jgi:hypothetical protein
LPNPQVAPPALTQIGAQITSPMPREPQATPPQPATQPLPPQQTVGSSRPLLPPARTASARPEPSSGLGLDGWLVDRLFGR